MQQCLHAEPKSGQNARNDHADGGFEGRCLDQFVSLAGSTEVMEVKPYILARPR